MLEPSCDRVESKCPVARQCGGCQIQELSYEKQLEFKEKKVRGNLERIGGFAPEELDEVMEPICGMEEPFYYRNKAAVSVWNRQTRAYCDRILCRTDPSDYSKHRVCSWRKTEQRNFGNDCGFHEHTSHYNI